MQVWYSCNCFGVDLHLIFDGLYKYSTITFIYTHSLNDACTQSRVTKAY